jgi:hypothetical protein
MVAVLNPQRQHNQKPDMKSRKYAMQPARKQLQVYNSHHFMQPEGTSDSS